MSPPNTVAPTPVATAASSSADVGSRSARLSTWPRASITFATALSSVTPAPTCIRVAADRVASGFSRTVDDRYGA
jgi:hypothetical protein